MLGVELVVAQEFEEGAMEVVGAALHRNCDLRAATETIFGGVGASLDFEFLDRFNGRHEIRDVDARVFGVDAVETDDLMNLALAIGADGESLAGNRETAEAVAAAGAITELHAG